MVVLTKQLGKSYRTASHTTFVPLDEQLERLTRGVEPLDDQRTTVRARRAPRSRTNPKTCRGTAGRHVPQASGARPRGEADRLPTDGRPHSGHGAREDPRACRRTEIARAAIRAPRTTPVHSHCSR